MRPVPAILLLMLLFVVSVPCCTGIPGGSATPSAEGEVRTGPGSYLFTDTRGNADRPIRVWTYRPASWNTSGPILIVLHGAERSGLASRDTWIPYAEYYSFLVAAPEFPVRYYPDDSWYPAGHLIDRDTGWQPEENWTYTAIEHIFDDLRNRTGARQETYLLFGHSAGAQFVHRMVTFLPEARFSRAVAANAGVYVMPDFGVDYGLGLRGSPLAEAGLRKVFSRKLILLSGEKDTARDSSLATFPAADAQGSNRFERAKAYFATAQREAAARNVTLNWEYHVIPGVGHSESGMAGPAAELLSAPG